MKQYKSWHYAITIDNDTNTAAGGSDSYSLQKLVVSYRSSIVVKFAEFHSSAILAEYS